MCLWFVLFFQLDHAVRTGAYDVLFTGDMEGDSISSTAATVLLSLPVDLRAQLAARILVVGGTSMAPGFLHRSALILLFRRLLFSNLRIAG